MQLIASGQLPIHRYMILSIVRVSQVATLTQRVNNEGVLNIVIADQLKASRQEKRKQWAGLAVRKSSRKS